LPRFCLSFLAIWRGKIDDGADKLLSMDWGKNAQASRKSLRRSRPRSAALIVPLEPRTYFTTTTIMPLGDSITQGWDGHDSYRYDLWSSLAQAGYDIDFIGSQNAIGSGSAPHVNSYDPNHEGHAGWSANQLRDNAANFATLNHPDIVLLHIGTNDVSESQPPAEIIDEVGGIIDNLRTVVPDVTVLLAQIIPAAGFVTATQNFNNLIPGLVSSKNTAQSPVLMVDQFTGFNPATDTFDGTHPNATGEGKMAAQWYTALQNLLPAPPPLPVGTYLSDLTPTSAANGWGPIQNDRSNGENGAADGSTILLAGTPYRKGLGVHAASDVTYNIAGGGYTDFVADLGVDDEVGSAGSVVFQVYIDNVLKYTSPTLTGSSATVPISIPIPGGSSNLRLVLNDAGDGTSADHGDWAMARLLTIPPTTPLITGIDNDSGASSSDGITSDRTLILSGTADPNNTVTITRIGSGVIGAAIADGTGAWSFDYTATTLADGTYQFTAQAADALNRPSAVSTPFNITIDATRPTVGSPDFHYLTSQSVTVVFSEDIGAYAPTATEAILANLTGASNIALAVNYDGATRTATFTFPQGLLADGNYRLTLKAGSGFDRAGNSLQEDFTFDFFLLGGDANHDRTVNEIDLGIISTHWNTSGNDYSQGDFNYDGAVNVADFKIFANHWQTTLQQPVDPAPISSTAPTSPSSSSARRRTRNVSVVS
jgi:lysophospholipase L1-like esterase